MLKVAACESHLDCCDLAIAWGARGSIDLLRQMVVSFVYDTRVSLRICELVEPLASSRPLATYIELADLADMHENNEIRDFALRVIETHRYDAKMPAAHASDPGYDHQ
jgi:hypothetical protein